MGQQEKEPRLRALVCRVHQNRALAQQICVLLKNHVGHGEHQRMAGMHQHGATEARFFKRLNSSALETDAVVAFQHRLLLPAIAACDAVVPLAYSDRNMSDLVTPRFTGMSHPAERI